MLFRELNRGKCKTYLLACERTRRAVLIDPVKAQVERYLAMLAYERLRLDAVIDTHTHADHPTGSFLLKDLTDASLIMHRRAPAPAVSRHVENGDTIEVGDLTLEVLYTPGHSADSMSVYAGDRVFTGDVLLIGGTGRADFAGGDAGRQYDSITGRLFTLPDETLVFPAHDYRGNTVSTIGAEKQQNPRIAGRTREVHRADGEHQFPAAGKNPGSAAAEPVRDRRRQDQVSRSHAIEPGAAVEPRRSERTAPGCEPAFRARRARAAGVHRRARAHTRQHTRAAARARGARARELLAHRMGPTIVVCRSGVRSTTAAAILEGLGFEQVYNLQGGMVDWNDRGLPVAR